MRVTPVPFLVLVAACGPFADRFVYVAFNGAEFGEASYAVHGAGKASCDRQMDMRFRLGGGLRSTFGDSDDLDTGMRLLLDLDAESATLTGPPGYRTVENPNAYAYLHTLSCNIRDGNNEGSAVCSGDFGTSDTATVEIQTQWRCN
jgi:hypothetical protein